MSTPRVLVSYASKNGSTAEIAGWVASTLRDANLAVDLFDAADVTDVRPYDAVVLGAAVYAGRWPRSARRFVSRHSRELQSRPVWLFSSGPLDHTADPHEGPPMGVSARRAMDRLGARGH